MAEKEAHANSVKEAVMRETFLPFSQPSISEEDIAAVGDVLRSGWITTGRKNAELENRFSEYSCSKGAVALSSATAGMQLVLHALQIGPGDEVITPSMTWVSTVNLVVLSGAMPVFVDVDRDTLMTNADLIKQKITRRTKLIIPVHFAGAAVDMESVRVLAQEKNIPLVEDAAHGVGTEYQGKRTGSLGTAIFSFHPIKNMTTGEGGMVCSDDAELLDTIRMLKFHGLGADAHDRNQQGRAPQAEVLAPGYKYNMTDMAATLGLGQLARLDGFIARRTKLAERYLTLLAEVDEVQPLTVPSWTSRHAWHLFIIRLNTEKAAMSRNDFMEELKRKNIGTGLHFRSVHQQRFYRGTMPQYIGALPATEWNSERICSLPLFPDMRLGDVDDVVDAIKEVLVR